MECFFGSSLLDLVSPKDGFLRSEIFCPVDPEKTPTLYKKEDLSPGLYSIIYQNGEQRKIDIRKPGKWNFLLKLMPERITKKILDIRYFLRKYEHIDNIFDSEIYIDPVSFQDLTDERKTSILERERVTKSLLLVPIKTEVTLWNHYYPENSLIDRMTIDFDKLLILEQNFRSSHNNIGNTLLILILDLVNFFKKWFFILDKSGEILSRYYFKRNYTQDLLNNKYSSILRITENIHRLVTNPNKYCNYTTYFSEIYDTETIVKKSLCLLILEDLNYLRDVMEYHCTYIDVSPDCDKCYDFRQYFWKFSSWCSGIGLNEKIDFLNLYEPDTDFYFNENWFIVNEEGNPLIWEIYQEGYYN